jgi:hypothetical protein
MTSLHPLTAVFNKFNGQEVQISEDHSIFHGRPLIKLAVSPSDKTIAELKTAIEEMGLKLRVILPGDFYKQDAPQNRVTVRIEKQDGKYQIDSIRLG